ncbi:MAG: bestrophin family ion channel [Bacteroidota bacterium]
MLLNKRIPVSYIFNKIKFDLIYVSIIASIVLFITNKCLENLPEMPLTIPTFIGTAISILLSFKLNQSYDRWWEARKIWGSIVNDSRSFVIQLQTLVKKGNDEMVKKIAYRQIAWCYCLGQSLRNLNPIENLEHFLSTPDIEEIKVHNNKPLAILQLNASCIKELQEQGQIELFSQIQFDDTFLRLCESQGKAERIKNTIFPVTYRLFLHFIIYLFIVTLSISLKDVSWYLETPLLLLISMAFFLLEKSATLMQDPFENKPTDTSMTSITRTIEINIKQLLKETNVPEPIKSDKFYIL